MLVYTSFRHTQVMMCSPLQLFVVKQHAEFPYTHVLLHAHSLPVLIMSCSEVSILQIGKSNVMRSQQNHA